MQVLDFIINDIKPLKISNNVSDLQLLFNQLTFSHIPVQDEDNTYLGSFSEADAYCFEKTKPLAEYKYSLENFFIHDTALLLDVLEAFATNSTNMMPVLNSTNDYIGYYELNDIISLFGDSPFFSEAGGVLIIEKGINDYSFSEIIQIIESNGGKVLGAFISKMTTDLVQITVKVGQTGLNDIIQTFRRYSYTIASEHKEDSYIESLKERSDYLKKYLNI